MNRPFASLMPRSAWLLTLLLAAALLISACSAGQVPQTGADGPQVALEITGSGITASGPAAPGVTTIAINNTGQTDLSVILARLNTGVTLDQFSTALFEDEAAAVNLVALGGGRDAPGGETSQFTAELKQGTYAVVAFSQDDSPPLLTTFEVSGEPGAASAPQATVQVDMVDFSFVLPPDLAAGQQTWEVTNSGGQWHEIVLFKPDPGFTQEQFLEMFQADEEPQGDPPFDTIGSFGPTSAGERGWINFDLEPGTYMAVCFLPDFASGQSHVEKGMIMTFEVGQ